MSDGLDAGSCRRSLSMVTSSVVNGRFDSQSRWGPEWWRRVAHERGIHQRCNGWMKMNDALQRYRLYV